MLSSLMGRFESMLPIELQKIFCLQQISVASVWYLYKLAEQRKTKGRGQLESDEWVPSAAAEFACASDTCELHTGRGEKWEVTVLAVRYRVQNTYTHMVRNYLSQWIRLKHPLDGQWRHQCVTCLFIHAGADAEHWRCRCPRKPQWTMLPVTLPVPHLTEFTSPDCYHQSQQTRIGSLPRRCCWHKKLDGHWMGIERLRYLCWCGFLWKSTSYFFYLCCIEWY